LFVVIAPSVLAISLVYLQSFLKPKQLYVTSFFIGLCTIALNWQHLLMTHCVNQSEVCYAQHGGFPYESVQVLAQMPGPQRIFNYYDWGGYLVWKLPQHQIFIDG